MSTESDFADAPPSLDDCVTLAWNAVINRAKVMDQLAAIPYRDRAQLFRHVRDFWKLHQKNRDYRELLGYLLDTLKEIPEFQIAKRELMRQEQVLEESIAEDRRKLAQVVRRHWRGRLIGSTQTITYRTPGSNYRWATKRKRRG